MYACIYMYTCIYQGSHQIYVPAQKKVPRLQRNFPPFYRQPIVDLHIRKMPMIVSYDICIGLMLLI